MYTMQKYIFTHMHSWCTYDVHNMSTICGIHVICSAYVACMTGINIFCMLLCICSAYIPFICCKCTTYFLRAHQVFTICMLAMQIYLHVMEMWSKYRMYMVHIWAINMAIIVTTSNHIIYALEKHTSIK